MDYNIRSLLVEKTSNPWLQLFRYTFVAGVALVADFSVLFCCTEFLGIHYLISAAFGFLVGLTTNYLLSVLWVFTNRNIQNRKMEFLFFALIGIVGLGLNEVFLWFFTEIVGFHYLISKIIATILGYFWNFGARKFLLFR